MSVIQNIGIEQSPPIANRAVKTPDLPSQQARASASGSGSRGQALVISLSNEAIDVANIQEAKKSLNDTAKSIRIADQSMHRINEIYIEQMKAALNAIRKQYPPFPPGSEERVNYLRNFNEFRKLIDQLSFSTEDRGAAAILAVSDGNSESIGVSAASNS